MEWTQRLKRRRIELGLHQADVADCVGRSRGAVAQWETDAGRQGFLPPNEMRKLAELLKMPVETLMWGDAPPDAATGALSDDERALVLGYRGLTPGQRSTLRAVLEGFLPEATRRKG